jgi:hypothetical protein
LLEHHLKLPLCCAPLADDQSQHAQRSISTVSPTEHAYERTKSDEARWRRTADDRFAQRIRGPNAANAQPGAEPLH